MATKDNAPNWKKIKAEYIKGGISQQKLADKYGVAYGTIHRRVLLEGWSAQRNECKKKADQKLTEKIADKQAEIMAEIAVLHDRAGLAAFKKLLKQIEDFPESGSTTKVIRETVKVQDVDAGEGEKPMKIPLKTLLASDLSETVKNFATLSKTFGMDAASKLVSQRVRLENGMDHPEGDGGFIEALDEVRPDAWELEDVPLNITDTEEAGDIE